MSSTKKSLPVLSLETNTLKTGFTSRSAPIGPKPPWLKIRLSTAENFQSVRHMVEDLSLHTVCQEARCPNIFECFSNRTATFMILGDICTRHCGFCAVTKGAPRFVDEEEPRHVAEAVKKLGLQHAVITSVNRDDLSDGGAGHFVETINWVKELNPDCKVEVLIPDFQGNWAALDLVMKARPDVLNHNTETVSRLYRRVRPDANYQQTMQLIQQAGTYRSSEYPVLTKSGIMCGLGETIEELHTAMKDLRAMDCDILTLGQYLRPTKSHLPVERFYTPEEFAELKQVGLEMGFRYVESGPLVRSSYHAHQHQPAN
ncbi:MAG: lipoyl synthase [Blastocatellia bacterium]|nr:lipoyl synthase [Blastocatellia bacterium]MBN8723498.1 lipoyl synthase [Acidobacteriota bacterium]